MLIAAKSLTLSYVFCSVAKCLGAKTVAQRALDCASECTIISHVVEDVEAVKAMEKFLGEFQRRQKRWAQRSEHGQLSGVM